MKIHFLTVLMVGSLTLLSSCASHTTASESGSVVPDQTPTVLQDQVQSSTQEGKQPGTHTFDVKSPSSGGFNNVPNNGSSSTAKMIAPLTQ